MKLFFPILFYYVLLSINLNAKNIIYTYSDLSIDSKDFFVCYHNPFGRFGLNMSDYKWEIGNYNSNNILDSLSICVLINSDSSTINFMFVCNNKVTKNVLFKTTKSNSYGAVFKLESELAKRQVFSCDRNGSYSISLTKDSLELYFLSFQDERKQDERKRIFSASN